MFEQSIFSLHILLMKNTKYKTIKTNTKLFINQIILV